MKTRENEKVKMIMRLFTKVNSSTSKVQKLGYVNGLYALGPELLNKSRTKNRTNSQLIKETADPKCFLDLPPAQPFKAIAYSQTIGVCWKGGPEL